jgi:putative transposase
MKWRKNARLKDYDYTANGYYFVTICTSLRKPLLDQYHREAEQILQSLPSRFPDVKLDFYSFMPDHLHAIFILSDANVSIGEIVRRYKALVTKTTGCKPFWEWNYYEHVIRNERALLEIRKYIQENPEKERIDLKAIYGRVNATATDREL